MFEFDTIHCITLRMNLNVKSSLSPNQRFITSNNGGERCVSWHVSKWTNRRRQNLVLRNSNRNSITWSWDILLPKKRRFFVIFWLCCRLLDLTSFKPGYSSQNDIIVFKSCMKFFRKLIENMFENRGCVESRKLL